MNLNLHSIIEEINVESNMEIKKENMILSSPKIKKYKKHKNNLTVLGIVTIMGILNIPHPIKTSNDNINENMVNTENIQSQHPIDFSLIKQYIQIKNPKILPGELDRFVYTIIRESKNLKLPPNAKIEGKHIDPLIFLIAIIETESTFDKFAISKSNARGYMQILPNTAIWVKKENSLNFSLSELHTTEINIMLGVKYLNYLSTQFDDIKYISLAYNVGDGNVKRGIYDIKYWNKIKKFYKEFIDFVNQQQKLNVEK